MTDLTHDYDVRDLVARRLEEDLLGGEFDRALSEAPLTRFVVGVLYPDTENPADALPESVEDTEEGEADGASEDQTAPDTVVDPAVSLSKVRHPRSMGLTIAVDPSRGPIEVGIDAARYTQDDESWLREDLPQWTETISCDRVGPRTRTVADDLDLRIVVRSPGTDGISSVTLSLVNTATAERGARDEKCWFNPRISVTAADGVLRTRPPRSARGSDREEAASQGLLFRDVHSYGVGHGCAVMWAKSRDGFSVSTTFLPQHELLLSEAAGGQSLDLSMDALAHDESLTRLDDLVDGYAGWIETLDGSGLDDDERDVLDRHREEAREAVRRMRSGITLLREDEDCRRAFGLMNAAMAQQRSRQEHHRSGGRGAAPSTADARWRPFQVAFILLNLRGVADPESDDRKIADLLWFPTGGGKTEAYLGVIGFAILLRRLRDPWAGGVSVLMRYTLRLLTLQQYERATGLVCALERQRLLHLPGSAPITIGLWVGQASTPNTLDAAKRALRRYRNFGGPGEDGADVSDPVQLRRCPWCGSPLTHENYTVHVDGMQVSCGFGECEFRTGLPVYVVDEDVYRVRPSLLIATVDKFAMLPWKAETGALLGAPTSVHADMSVVGPDLVVQDELHLISGPLGTMVGLYETAVDAIAGTPAPPKVVASTATIRRAGEQVRAVFARDARQFPPRGLTHTDSYFAVEQARELKASREYVGVMAPGTSHATLMVRVYASLLQSSAMVPADDPAADLYWTLLGYFNSLRVLGGAYIQVLDDIPDQVRVLARRRGEDPRGLVASGDGEESTARVRIGVEELTSRRKSTEIPELLRLLGQPRGKSDALDVMLATNMISVGVDVDRLGLMVVMGQPQTSSEYIQATSRVGRRRPGLVVTLYNAARSRDLSHYEDFTGYHQMLYRHVEATGATPFAPRARDRALHAVLVALIRHTVSGATDSKDAARIATWGGDLDPIVRTIVERVRATGPVDGDGPTDQDPALVGTEVEKLIDAWRDAEVQHYEGWFSKRPGSLLGDASRAISENEEPDKFPPTIPPWPTMTSLRDVDAESALFMVKRRRERG